MKLTQIAKSYKKKGLSPIPLNGNKQPLWNWQKYQDRFMTDGEIDKSFIEAEGIGIICGKISGGKEGYSLCVIDMDCKYFDSEINYKQVFLSIPKELRNKLLITTTRSGGYHIYFRTPLTGGNKKYAMRFTTDKEKEVNPKEKVLVLIENRFEGGLVASIGTEGYNLVSKTNKIPYITAEEHMQLDEIMCSFNRVINEEDCFEQVNEEKKNRFLQSPFDEANKRLDALGLLYSHGYTTVGSSNGKEIRLKRPGSTASTHSGYFKVSENRYVNFSTSSEFEGGKSYSASELFTLLECNSNWSLSYKKLIEQGYGIPIDLTKKVKEFIKAFRNGDLDKLLKLHFNAEKDSEGKIVINNQKFSIK